MDAFLAVVGTGIAGVLVAVAAWVKALAAKVELSNKLAVEASARTAQQVQNLNVKADAVIQGVAQNTSLTQEAKEAAASVKAHTDICNEELERLSKVSLEHQVRIGSLETQMAALRTSMDSVTKNIDSTRHEMRGHLQVLSNKLDIMSITKASPASEA